MATASGLSLFDAFMWTGAASTRVINASTTKVGAIYRATKAGSIRWIGIACTALSGSPTLDLRAETISSGFPSGSLWGTNTNASYAPGATNSFVWTQLTTDAVVSEGDAIAAVVGYVSGTSATVLQGSNVSASIHPATYAMTAGTWLWAGGIPCVCLKYSDGTILRGGIPASQVVTATFQSGSSPNERAVVFTAPAGLTLIGVRAVISTAAATTFTANLYQGTATTPVSGGVITVGAGGTVNGNILAATLYFPNPITLTAGQDYRLSLKATAAANLGVERFVFPSTAERDVVMGEARSDTRAGSSWIGETSTTSEMIFPLFSGVDSGGGLIRTSWQGGYAG